MSEASVIGHRRDIDGLRSLAVLLVLIFHFDLFSYGKGGFLGVDVFFVISGYLITSIILKQLRNDTFSFREFYTRRIRRLAPALFTVLILVMIVGGFILLPTDYTKLSEQMLATQLYFSNFYFWRNIGYFGLQADSTLLLHTWSLAVEEQFYLLFPMTLYLIFRFHKAYLWYWMLAGAIVSFSLNIAFVDIKPEATFYLMPTRGWELLCGGLVVYLLHKPLFLSRLAKEIIGVVSFFLILLSALLYNEEVVFPGYYALLPTLGTMLLILTGDHQGTFTSRLLGRNIPVYIGKLSYSLYLVHWPIHIFASKILQEEYDTSWRIGMFALTILVSMLVFHAIEDPIRKSTFRKGVISKVKFNTFSYYFTGLTASVLLFSVVFSTNGLPVRFPDNVLKFAKYMNDESPILEEEKCQPEGRDKYETNDFCRIGEQNQTPQWVVFGDSHALSIHGAVDLWLKKRGEAGLFMYHHGCLPLKGVDLFKSKNECLQFTDNIYDYLGRSDEVKNVFIVSTWLQAAEGILTTESNTKLSIDESLQLFDSQFTETMEFLKSLGKKTNLWAPVPGAKGNVPETLAKSETLTDAIKVLEYSLEEYQEKFDFFFSALEQNKSLIHNVFFPAEALCTSGQCSVLVEEKPIYSDDAHIAYSSTPFWAQFLEKQTSNPNVRRPPKHLP